MAVAVLPMIVEGEGDWVKFLELGDMVYCTKEEEYYVVMGTYQNNARIRIRQVQPIPGQNDWMWTRSAQDWYVRPNGDGLDGKVLLEPCVGTCFYGSQPVSTADVP